LFIKEDKIMRIGQVNQDNYKDMLRIIGVKNPKSLEKLHGESEGNDKGLDQFGQKKGDYSFEAQAARAVASGRAIEGMVVRPGDESWKVIVPVSDSIKQKVIDNLRQTIIANGNGTITAEQGDKAAAIAKEYLKTLPPEQRLSASWTLQKIEQAEGQRISDYIKSQVPGWTHGQKFDTSILTKSNFGLNHMDIKA
jgi:hypothetical protein